MRARNLEFVIHSFGLVLSLTYSFFEKMQQEYVTIRSRMGLNQNIYASPWNFLSITIHKNPHPDPENKKIGY